MREEIELPEDSNGEPIYIGDIVYTTPNQEAKVTGTKFTAYPVVGIGGSKVFVAAKGRVTALELHSKFVTHESWKQITEDSELTACQYTKKYFNGDCMGTIEFSSCSRCGQRMAQHILSRAKSLVLLPEEDN